MGEHLQRYRDKRRLERTPEPSAGSAAAKGCRFVVQKHDARNLHYDLRLEIDGVLASWAVPKGPSLDPSDKRLAVRTEDHPLEYADFEGQIPEGEYGGGTVLVWDRGSWQPEDDARTALDEGRLTFALDGHKLSGRWHLIRTDRPETGNWLLMKAKDDDAARSPGDITEERPESVLTRRNLEDVAEEAHPHYRSVRLTHPDRVLFPEMGITKVDLAEHYRTVMTRILPHIRGRPLMVLRCPEGREGGGFFQKHVNEGTPEQLAAARVEEKKGVREHLMVEDEDGLFALVQLGTLEIHAWNARADRLDRPDLLVFDLDPGEGVGPDEVADAAAEIRDRLRHLGLETFCKVTGGKGYHVLAPLERRAGWEEVTAFAQAFAQRLEEEDAERWVASASKSRRHGRVFVDYLRNGRGNTAVAPFSTRARRGAPVAAPIAWRELRRIGPHAITLESLRRRLTQQKSDPWEGYFEVRQSITQAMQRAVGL